VNQRVPYPMQQGHVEWGGGPHGGGGDSLEWVLFALLLLLILLVIAQLALALMRRPRFGGPRHMRRGMHASPGGAPWGRPDPLSIARMRYARGEIGRDEYVQLAQDLGGEPEPPPPPA
jgi:uncharacterized membrane protein